MENIVKKNPWMGLESYKEGQILYGRDEDIRDLAQCVFNDTETLLYGKSGIGKSSILNAGILPAARRNGFLPIIIRLSHKEEKNYLSQIKDAIIKEKDVFLKETDWKLEIRIQDIVSTNIDRKETIYDFFHRYKFYDKEGNRLKLLIIFDQFEEIFSLQKDESKKKLFFREIGNYINDIIPNEFHMNPSSDGCSNAIVKLDTNADDNIFDDIDIERNFMPPSYVTDNEIHFIFTIREDFLSEFEYYTSSIPSLKHNRYGLRPINEEQAAQIIMRPAQGLIEKSVAKIIIEKVTGRTDFKLDGIPEIEVDAAVLSLYLNRLYENKTEDKITQCLVEQKEGEIIYDFYKKSISGLSEEQLEYLENNLINGQGRRDNIAVYDAINKGGLSQDIIDELCNNRKILRKFNYAGVLRLEYIHDIICPVVIKNRELRKERILIEAKSKKEIEKQLKLAQKRSYRNKILLITICSLFSLFLIIGGIYFYKPQKSKYSIHLAEDKSVNMTEYWKARVAISQDGQILVSGEIDKTNPTLIFEIPPSKDKDLQYDVDFLIGNFGKNKIIGNFPKDKSDVVIPLSHISHRKQIKGKVACISGSKAPIAQALVIIDDQLAKTNHKGEFLMYVDSSFQDNTIRILKKGYKLYEGKLQDKTYRLEFINESNFINDAKSMDAKIKESTKPYNLVGHFYGIEGRDTLKGMARMNILFRGDSIYGYAYYDKSYQRENNKFNAYILIDGIYDKKDNSFSIHFVDAVNNEAEYTGNIKNGTWYGESFDKDRKIGFFSFKPI